MTTTTINFYDPDASMQCPRAEPLAPPLPATSLDPYSTLVLVPFVPLASRDGMFERAVESVLTSARATPSPRSITIQPVSAQLPDGTFTPAAQTRNRGLAQFVEHSRLAGNPIPRWVTFLDDDDEMLPQHLPLLIGAALNHTNARNTTAPLIYPWYHVQAPPGLNSSDPLSLNPLAPPRSRGDGLDYGCGLAHEGPVTPFQRPFDEASAHHLQYHGNFIPVTVLTSLPLLLAVGGFPTPFSTEWPHKDCEDWGLWLRLLPFVTPIHVPQRTWIWNHHGNNTSGDVKLGRGQ